MKRDKWGNKTHRNVPYIDINWYIDIKESKVFYKKFEKKKLRKYLKNYKSNFISNSQMRKMNKDGWNWSKVRGNEMVKQCLREYEKEKNSGKINL